MRITQLNAYRTLEEQFKERGYTLGTEHDIQPGKLTSAPYIYAIRSSKLGFEDVPEEYRTKEFFLHALSGACEELVDHVKKHSEDFDRQFFKDHIATNYQALEFEQNDFEYMPLEFIDEEMVACAMFKTISSRYVEERGHCEAWFYSVYKRKPVVLTQELYTLGARCFASKKNGNNRFLDITPEEYQTAEYFFAMCLRNDTKVMEDIPKNFLTDKFLVELFYESVENIKCFSEVMLERKVSLKGIGTVKVWQAALIRNGNKIKDIALNDERIKFFLSRYPENSHEYKYSFKEHYKRYIEDKISNGATKFASEMSLTEKSADLVLGNSAVTRRAMLPILTVCDVPEEYSNKDGSEEYLLEVYKKIGVQVMKVVEYYYYSAVLPENVSIVRDDTGYCVKGLNGEILLHYYDRGPFYDRAVAVDKINVTI